MSVLVDRLRKEAQHDEVEGGFAVALLREAADEIERLERNATAFCAEISGLIVRAGVPAFGYPQDGIRELGARIQRLEKQLAASLNDAKASTGLVPVGAKSITVKRGNGNSFLAWFTTEDGREISLAHCPLAANSEMEIALDSHNVILNTWPKDDDASTASPEVSVVADKQQQGDLGVALSERPDQSTNGGTPQDTSISERLRVNRQELMQNGTCAYMSPRPNGLWVNWHLVAEAIAEIERLQGLPDTIQGLQALRGRIDGKLHRLVMGDPRATVGSHSAGSNDSTMSKSTESGAAVDKGETGNG